MERLGIIGFGVMGRAFAEGLARSEPGLSLVVYDVKADKLSGAGTRTLTAAASPAEVVRQCGHILLCVKPQDLGALMPELRPHSRGKGYISILAGRRIDTLAEGLGTEEVARFMPNIAATVGRSLVGVSFHPRAGSAFREECLKLSRAVGSPLEVPEKLLAAMTGVSGSGIAYVLTFIHALALGGVAAGFDYETALKAAVGCVEGAVALLGGGAHPAALASRVISPAGTTIQGMRALERGGMTAAVMEAVEAAARRAVEFER
jgi:pyrroline-5-carboxylate reductase